jgi:hypothetical protein
MVTEWEKLGFIIRNPYLPPTAYAHAFDGTGYMYVSIETKRR